MKLDTHAWGEFKIGDLFEVRKGTRLTRADMIEGNIRFVSAANTNNGITAHIANNNHIHSEGTISVCYNGNGGTGKAFYQDRAYWASDDVHVLYPKFNLPADFENVEWTGLNATVGLFIAAAIEKVGRQKYSFTNKWKLEHMREDKIKLPVRENNMPDWNYIEQYMSVILDTSIAHLSAISKSSFHNKKIDVSKWDKFRIGDIFDPVKAGYIGSKKRIGSATRQPDNEHTVPLTCAKYDNNGIMYWGNKKDYQCQENVIAVIRDGALSTGKVYAERDQTSVYSHSYFFRFKGKNVSFYVNLFLSRVLETIIYPRYSREDTCTWDRIKNDLLPLPVDSINQPDWNYMESFMRSVLQKTDSAIDVLNTVLQRDSLQSLSSMAGI